jgi:hypothetical protein
MWHRPPSQSLSCALTATIATIRRHEEFGAGGLSTRPLDFGDLQLTEIAKKLPIRGLTGPRTPHFQIHSTE